MALFVTHLQDPLKHAKSESPGRNSKRLTFSLRLTARPCPLPCFQDLLKHAEEQALRERAMVDQVVARIAEENVAGAHMLPVLVNINDGVGACYSGVGDGGFCGCVRCTAAVDTLYHCCPFSSLSSCSHTYTLNAS